MLVEADSKEMVLYNDTLTYSETEDLSRETKKPRLTAVMNPEEKAMSNVHSHNQSMEERIQKKSQKRSEKKPSQQQKRTKSQKRRKLREGEEEENATCSNCRKCCTQGE